MNNPIHKMSFLLDENDFDSVALLAKEQGISIGDLVRKTLAMHFFLTDVQEKGGKVIVEKNDGLMLCMTA